MRSLSVVMVVMLIFSSTLWAAGPVFSGSLRTSGVVLANSVHLPDGGTVRSGDTILARPGGWAVISSPSHGRVEVRPNSEARLAGDQIALARGAVAASRVAVQVNGYTVRPQEPASAHKNWYAVAHRNGRLVVAAHRGNVLIASHAGPPVLVPEGSFAQQTTSSPDQQQQPPSPEQQQEQESGKKKKGAGAAGAAAAGGWTIGALSHGASVALVVGIGAGVAVAAAGLAVALSDEAPSPSQ